MSEYFPIDERLLPGEPLMSYALREYETGVDPVGQLHSANILFASLEAAGYGPRGAQLCEATRHEFGRSRTAWGIKSEKGVPSWELYYYQHSERGEPVRELTMRRVDRVLERAGMRRNGEEMSPRRYFSMSFDVTHETLIKARPTEVHVYLDQSLTVPPSATSYRVGHRRLEMENVYYLCRQQSPDLDFLHRFFWSSARINPDTCKVASVLWPELLKCDHVAVAHKPNAEAIYYGGITMSQLEIFFERTDFNPSVREYVFERRAEFDHLRFDVGFDYIGGASGEILILKSGIYGAL